MSSVARDDVVFSDPKGGAKQPRNPPNQRVE